MGVLRKLVCGSGKKEEGKATGKHVSLAPGTAPVVEKQKNWLKEEQSSLVKLHKNEAMDVESKFKEIIQRMGHKVAEAGRARAALDPSEAAEETELKVEKSELRKIFAEMGIMFEEEVFEKLYVLFDADNDGMIDVVEFTVTFCFLMYRGSAKDKVELAFRLFDTNRNGSISRREFNDMIAAVIGNRLKNVLAIARGRQAFQEFLEKEFADELLRFVDAVEYLHGKSKRSHTMSYAFAEALLDQYLRTGAKDEINVSDKVRKLCHERLEQHKGEEEVPIYIFDEAADEVLHLMEAGPLPRFKAKLRESNEMFADTAWKEMGLDPEKDDMTLEMFRAWTEKTPGLFNFFDELHDALEMATVLPPPLPDIE
ncbi:Lysophosphatidylcholine acyltransferase 2 (LPC acyltransferase 2) (LPCAT-2) (LysoPC acyltransferase 2) (1-acylglycerol-3-phosphate O-acyltransferase 11) (1-AGP acyltransferase 11) (1-AGPAT 11) (1-acylglycerophosphocholine O-acyltransferase) (1-alkenylglycerophosphocholine O-acyltransferase) (1-alkylglycerophosphocholine O-acetyltransferase) (Acetyl-CoA:lyso-platelet-activating factor acetyltransferase) (Acetyl-CoA:lyso-PAF acetyltransferase) (Lyso-PAF acetyltransferase) (LysoPAFAT) (Acyltransferase-like 1) [Durusdinium trenchii]|uniref:Calmodulin n=1 Tax=Durusdinium trenchii TaxID=1381693 RepID=A0ABP0J802_9DINO